MNKAIVIFTLMIIPLGTQAQVVDVETLIDTTTNGYYLTGDTITNIIDVSLDDPLPTPEQLNRLESKRGIRDIKLGSLKSKYTDLFQVQNNFYNGESCGTMYRRKNENLFIGDVKVDNIEYKYFDNVLTAIYVHFRSAEDLYKITGLLTELYGLPSNDDGALIWESKSYSIAGYNAYILEYIDNSYGKRCLAFKQRKIDKIKKDL